MKYEPVRVRRNWRLAMHYVFLLTVTGALIGVVAIWLWHHRELFVD